MASTKKATATDGFTAEERAAIKERAAELRTSKSRASKAEKAAEEAAAVLEKIAEMPGPDRAMAQRVHAVIMAAAPQLAPKLWYGMPAYANAGKTICFFQPAQKFKTRYATLGFNQDAQLDDGNLWPVAYALKELTPADETSIAELIKRAVG
ncbi:iron chaperone [Dactylosporangium sp. CA-233914]|uniref:iron chaperone n=1 Tax=Dactylosporangium sp. CA-233914 TaxID=3239934 RepID=UPI003D8E2A2A